MFGIIIGSMADLFVNLSAGWFGAAIIIPLYETVQKRSFWALIINSAFGILALIASIFLRSQL